MNRGCKFGVPRLRGPNRLKAELQTSKPFGVDFTQSDGAGIRVGGSALIGNSRRRKLRQNTNSDGPIVPRWHGETYALHAFSFEFTNLPLARTQLR